MALPDGLVPAIRVKGTLTVNSEFNKCGVRFIEGTVGDTRFLVVNDAKLIRQIKGANGKHVSGLAEKFDDSAIVRLGFFTVCLP